MIRRMLVLLVGTVLCFALVISLPVDGTAGLPAPPLPPLLIPVPPPVVLIPGTYAYFAPDVDIELIFYGGYWYRPFGGGWYRAPHYNGPWGFVSTKNVPGYLTNLPPGYRRGPHTQERIPYGHLKKNWKTWEQNKHWDKPGKPEKSEKPGKHKKQKSVKAKKHEPSEHEPGKREHGK